MLFICTPDIVHVRPRVGNNLYQRASYYMCTWHQTDFNIWSSWHRQLYTIDVNLIYSSFQPTTMDTLKTPDDSAWKAANENRTRWVLINVQIIPCRHDPKLRYALATFIILSTKRGDWNHPGWGHELSRSHLMQNNPQPNHVFSSLFVRSFTVHFMLQFTWKIPNSKRDGTSSISSANVSFSLSAHAWD